VSTWNLSGRVVIACNCDWGCPCNFNAPPTSGKCEGGWIWAIDKGKIDGVAVDSLGVTVYADWPGAIHEGGGRAVAYLDARADERQRSALGRLLRGEIGGPWGIFSKTYEMTPPEPAEFDLALADYDSRCRIGDGVELSLTTIRNPVSNAEVHPEIVLPEGLVVKGAKLAVSRVFKVRSALSYDHSGRYAAFGQFSYASAS
jgi:hypothetical protein